MNDKNQAEYKSLLQCEKNSGLGNIDIKNKYFLLVVLLSGQLEFSVKEFAVLAEGPCILCFDEKVNPKFEKVTQAEYFCIRFHPTILDTNLTFGVLGATVCVEVAQAHNFLLLRPFTEEIYYTKMEGEYGLQIENACEQLYKAANQEEENRLYRCRSYLLEMLIVMERLISIKHSIKANVATWRYKEEERIRAVVRYIMEHFDQDISLNDITENCGLKTVQHFSRVFKKHVKQSPSGFRQRQWEKRKKGRIDSRSEFKIR